MRRKFGWLVAAVAVVTLVATENQSEACRRKCRRAYCANACYTTCVVPADCGTYVPHDAGPPEAPEADPPAPPPADEASNRRGETPVLVSTQPREIPANYVRVRRGLFRR